MRTKLISWLGIALSIGAVIYLGFRLDWPKVMEALALADLRWLIPAMILYVSLFIPRGMRWAVLLRHVKPIKNSTATEVFLVGFMANNLMPLRLGDVARAFVLSRREGISASTSFSTVMLERVFDGLTVVAFLATVLFVAPPADHKVIALGYVSGAVFVGALAVCALVTWNETRALALARLVMRPFPDKLGEKALSIIKRLADGLHTLRNPAATIEVLLLSLVIWSAEVAVYWVVQQAFGLQVPVLGLALVMAVLSLGLTVPSAPGFIGVYEGLVIWAISLYGVGSSRGTAFALLMHVVHYVPGTLLGLISTWRTGLKIRDLRGKGEGKEDDSSTKMMVAVAPESPRG